MSLKDELREALGGSWDGDAPELHGLVRGLKVELLRSRRDGRWIASAFDGHGQCLATRRGEDACAAARAALEASRP